ncbi:hypothetical protein C9374_007566 [Naegleria lovaniensis]|uniref:Uncharacterized protein n=1 Tax=Naegleria lovaniensis TaxID=51637 RepID=A0AA88KII4_NAELO|nr:uncharacterized protein C9374_007566 [Naegleria lovaniensis]KAG2378928.1 hypothetical protein C9374_007566 [Naegleria lovaniensis]
MSKRKTNSTSRTPLIQDTHEFEDIFQNVFQFMETCEIYPLQHVSSFFFQMIEKLKQFYIRPVYEIGIVSHHKEQLESFVRQQLGFSRGLIPTLSSEEIEKLRKQRTNSTYLQYGYYGYHPSQSDNNQFDTSELNDGEALKNVNFSSSQIHVFERIERHMIFKQDRFRVIFFPLLCEKKTSVAVDDFNRLEGFIFLKPEKLDSFESMPEGAQITSKYTPLDQPQLKMPVKKYGLVNMLKNGTREQINNSLLECLMYIMQNSNRCLKLDHSISTMREMDPSNSGSSSSNGGHEQQFTNIISKTSTNASLKLLDLIHHIIVCKMSNEELSQYFTQLFQNRYSLYHLLMTKDIRYMTKRLSFFNLPYPTQVKLLKRLYSALIATVDSFSHNEGGCVKIKHSSDDLVVTLLQDYLYEKDSYGDEKEMRVRMVQIHFHLLTEKVDFVYEENYDVSKNLRKNCIVC